MKKPNANGKMALFIIGALICCVVGFVGGQLSSALTTLPGDADDPVVTQSYVETQLGERLATLTTRIEELEAEVASLKGTATPSTTTPSNGTTTTPSTSTNTNTNTNTNATTSTTLTITGNTLRVRTGPGTSYDVVTSLAKGDKVTKLGVEGDWYRIQTSDGKTGYISSQYAQ